MVVPSFASKFAMSCITSIACHTLEQELSFAGFAPESDRDSLQTVLVAPITRQIKETLHEYSVRT